MLGFKTFQSFSATNDKIPSPQTLTMERILSLLANTASHMTPCVMPCEGSQTFHSATSNLQSRLNSYNQISLRNHKDKPAKKRKAQAAPRLAATRSVRTGQVISATRAARSFSELLDRVCYRGESFVIERGGELVCE